MSTQESYEAYRKSLARTERVKARVAEELKEIHEQEKHMGVREAAYGNGLCLEEDGLEIHTEGAPWL